MYNLTVEQLASGKEPQKVLLFVRGYLSAGPRARLREEQWLEAVHQAGWGGDVWKLVWDASESAAILARALQSMVRFRGDWRLVTASTLASTLHNWIVVRRRADEIGRRYLVPTLKDHFPHHELTIVAHSAGARIALQALRENLTDPPIKNLVLLGAAVSRGHRQEWARVIHHLSGILINVYNPHDWVLRVLYRVAQCTVRDACGASPILLRHPRILNWNAAEMLGRTIYNHEHYRAVLPAVIRLLQGQAQKYGGSGIDTNPNLC